MQEILHYCSGLDPSFYKLQIEALGEASVGVLRIMHTIKDVLHRYSGQKKKVNGSGFVN